MRHGSTVNNDAGIYIGTQDVPLDDNGRKEAEETIEFLTKYPIKLIVCSPLSRAQETAQMVGQALGLQPEPDPRLVPWEVGFMTGKPKGPLKEVRKWFIDHPDQPVPGGESFGDFQAKFEPTLGQSIKFAEKNDGIVLIIAHSNQITATEKIINGQAFSSDQTNMVQPAGVIAVMADPNGYSTVPVFRTAEEAEQGTKHSGYAEDGPYHCEDCVHLIQPGQPYCKHPEVVKDQDLQDRLVQIGTQPAIQINLEHGCCRYVNNPQTPSDNPTIIS